MKVRAAQWTGKNFDEIMKLIGENHGNKVAYENAEERAIGLGKIPIKTPGGVAMAEVDDYVMRNAVGEFHVLSEKEFELLKQFIEQSDFEY